MSFRQSLKDHLVRLNPNIVTFSAGIFDQHRPLIFASSIPSPSICLPHLTPCRGRAESSIVRQFARRIRSTTCPENSTKRTGKRWGALFCILRFFTHEFDKIGFIFILSCHFQLNFAFLNYFFHINFQLLDFSTIVEGRERWSEITALIPPIHFHFSHFYSIIIPPLRSLSPLPPSLPFGSFCCE